MKRMIGVGLALLLAACSSRPSEEVIRSQFLNYLDESGYSAIYDVVSFEKLNGIPRNENTYLVDIAYRIVFKVDLVDAPRALREGAGNYFSAGVEAANLGVRFGNFHAGDEATLEERVKFIRSEQGWLLEPGER